MIWGLSIATFTLVHVVISLIGIVTGLIVVWGMLAGKRLNAMTAKIHLLSRSTEASPGYRDTKTYPLGLQADGTQLTVGPYNDGFKRHAYTETIRMNNPAGRRES